MRGISDGAHHWVRGRNLGREGSEFCPVGRGLHVAGSALDRGWRLYSDGASRMTEDITWKRLAAIRELASLGLYGKQIAEALRITPGNVGRLCNVYGIRLRDYRGETPLKRAVRAGYAAGKSPATIAAEIGSPIASVKSTACQLGITAGNRSDPAKWRRGFHVPDHLVEEYRELRRTGCTVKEAGQCLGLVEREAPAPRLYHPPDHGLMAASA
jgi:hypothetical protein